MSPTLIDRLTPTAVGLVSRAWVLREVAAVPGLDAGARRRLVDVLSAYQPPRRQPMRDNAIAWAVLLNRAAMVCRRTRGNAAAAARWSPR
jgi:hypothetical protein